MVIFVGGITGILFYLGVTQAFVQKMAWLMRHTMGTTGIESVSLTANIFFSMVCMSCPFFHIFVRNLRISFSSGGGIVQM